MNATRGHPPPPAGAVLAALALWGWQTGLLPWALGMALLLGVARVAPVRVTLEPADFTRLWNLTTLLFIGTGLYLFLIRQGSGTVGALVTSGSPAGRLDELRQFSQTALTFLRWMPFLVFPFVLVHAWGAGGALPWSSFAIYRPGRRQTEETSGPEWAVRRLQPGYLFLVLVLFASGAGTDHAAVYHPLLLGVVAWGLWPFRNRRYGVPVWAGMWVALLGLSLLARGGMTAMREAWQAFENRLVQRTGEGGFDATRTFTAMGAVGRLKQSGQVVLRVRTGPGQAPGLLAEAAFTRFRSETWSSGHREFQPVAGGVESGGWPLTAAPPDGRWLTVGRYTADGDAPLALPADAVGVRDLVALAVETNRAGATRVRGALPLAQYRVERAGGAAFVAPPDAEDSDLAHLGPADAAVIREVAGELGLGGGAAREAVARVERHFSAGFEYSVWQGRQPARTNSSPLARFLRETRSGHCEYFATATVLLLRAAGVPARYVVGWSPEARGDDEWWARGRDAHAWCMAWVEGRWVEVDTTPGTWREKERAALGAGVWERVRDGFSQGWYRFTVWRQEGGNWQALVFVTGMLVLGWLGWRQVRGTRWRRSRSAPSGHGRAGAWPGADSELLEVIRRLETVHGARASHETLRAWLARVAPSRAADAGWQEVLALHDRLRFDPAGLPAAERERLRGRARALDLPRAGTSSV